MITSWYYGGRHASDELIKSTIRKNNYKAIDVGASVYNWSWPEAKYVVDILSWPHHIGVDDIHHFNLNLDNEHEHEQLLEYVENNGKFDYSICSHTLEDLMFPLQTIKLLSKISNQGVVVIPSKYSEFRYNRTSQWRGEPHHKQFFDVIDDKICLFPKLTFIERDERSDLFTTEKYSTMPDLIIFWESELPYTYFNEGKVDLSDDVLINNYYNALSVHI